VLGASLREDGSRVGFRNIVYVFFYFGRWTKSKKKESDSVSHTPLSKTYSVELIYIMFKNSFSFLA